MRQPDPVDIHVGARVRRTRLFRGIAAKTFARELNISARSLSRLERGEVGFSAAQLVEAARILKVEIGFFCSGFGVADETGKGDGPTSNVVAFPAAPGAARPGGVARSSVPCVVLAFPARPRDFRVVVDVIG